MSNEELIERIRRWADARRWHSEEMKDTWIKERLSMYIKRKWQ